MKQETLEQIVSKQFQKEFNKEVKNVLVQELKKKEMKQTAVEWLISQLNKQGFAQVVTDEEIDQAKEMEKQQIIEARVNGMVKGIEIGSNTIDYDLHKTHEQYYNETYNLSQQDEP